MKKKRVFLKLSVIGVAVLIACSLLINPVYGNTSAQLNNQLNTTNKNITSAKNNLKDVKTQQSATLKQIQNLNAQISNTENSIAKLNKEISSLEQDISNKEREIEEKQEAYDNNMDMFKNRLVASYEIGNTTYLDVILSSKKMTDVLSNWYYLSEIAEADKALLEEIDAQKTELENAKEKLESDKAKIEANKKTVEKEQKSLVNAKGEKNKQMNKLSAEEKALEKELAQFEKDQKDILARLAALSSQNYPVQSPNKYGYISPLAGRTTKDIYCGWMGYPNHRGVDFSYAGINGQNILAVKAGKVVISEAMKYANGTYRSYGEYVVIDHLDGSKTLYAHGLSGSRTVKVGDIVSQGQVIMRVGSTGNSTGPHLHFEVIINGVQVNPTPYLP